MPENWMINKLSCPTLKEKGVCIYPWSQVCIAGLLLFFFSVYVPSDIGALSGIGLILLSTLMHWKVRNGDMEKPIDKLKELVAQIERGDIKLLRITESWNYEREDATGNVYRTGMDKIELFIESKPDITGVMGR